MVLGIMGLAGIPLDLMTIMIASVAMGISVDDTIHYIHRYLEELRHGTEEQAVERTQLSVGYAMLCTTLIVVLGFSLLIFSDFIPSVLFGLLTGIAMGMAVVFDFSILPVLLKKFVRSAPKSIVVPRTLATESAEI
jgi:predicted RND superfamily exporter protein